MSTPLPVAVITGGAGGIGLAAARVLGRDHHLVLTSTNRGRLEAAVAVLSAEGLSAEAIASDVTDGSSVEAVFRRAAHAGIIKSVAHAAGVSPQMGSGELLLDVNARGTAIVGEVALRYVVEGGAVALVSSLAAHTFPGIVMPIRTYRRAMTDIDSFTRRLKLQIRAVPPPLRPGIAYAIGKHFTCWYAETRAAAFGEVGARIVSVSPGSCDTDMGRLEERTGSGVIVANSALKRYGRPEEIADVIGFCLGQRAAYLTGTDILCDGGARAGHGMRVNIQLARRVWSDRQTRA